MSRPGATAIRALLHDLIDYAGLFPPASLNMAEAVRKYAAYQDGEYAWALGRFVVPGARLAELEGTAFPLSILSPASAAPPAFAEVIEVKADTTRDIVETSRVLPPGITAYFEIPIARDPADLIEVIAETKTRAKVRTGGLTPEMFPASQDLARFIASCASARVPFKATAGLHHPIRSVHNFTYDPNSAFGLMHGFVNVFLAAALVYCGGTEEDAVRILDERSPEAFHFDQAAVEWHGNRLTAEQIAESRRHFAISFGSCSFDEPIGDLRDLGLL